MSNAAQALGVQTSEYEYKGVKYVLSPHDLEDYALYELDLERTGWVALKRARHMGWLQEYEYKEMVREWLAVLATHLLSFGSPDYIKSTNTVPGLQKMLELSLAHRHPEFKRDEFGGCPGEQLLSEMVRRDSSNVIEALARLDDNS